MTFATVPVGKELISQMNYVLCEIQDGIASIRLNRPEVLNALNGVMLHELTALFRQLRTKQAVRAVLLTGNGRAFCAGAELRPLGTADNATDAGEILRKLYNPLILEMRTLPKPIVVAVNGIAAGAGMSIALAGDILLGSDTASFCPAFSKIGLIPDAGSTFFLPRAIGEHRARALAILAERVEAHDAARQGLLYKVLPDDRLMSEAQAMAGHLARMPTRAFALIKQALSGIETRTLEDQLELEAKLQSAAARTDDFREGVAAFLAKRTPIFVGS
jgi:2-(1,2-epoxy-1,2-dihydrophenyl)acetyl-CoA isomerase